MAQPMKERILSALSCLTTAFAAHPATAEQTNSATTVLMVPPEGFRHNEQTAASNVFQDNAGIPDTAKLAMQEFHDMVTVLRNHHVNVLILDQDKNLPDAVFPNNWFSTEIDQNGKTDIYIYPMLTQNRRDEVNIDGLTQLLRGSKININKIIDMRSQTDKVLEGTGSLILDRKNRIVYAALSERTHPELVVNFANKLNYEAILFHATDTNGHPIYHTNVVMGLADDFSVACLMCIKDDNERSQVEASLKKLGPIVDISLAQLHEMCGNVLSLRNRRGEKLFVMSERAQRHFTSQQLALIQEYNNIIPVAISTIERVGGGSARCMMAEIFHPLSA
jgi:hypothetical protein